MENASKALLIAGSILVVILLIAMGVRVLNSTKGTSDATESTMKTAEETQYYSKFTKYIGDNQSKAQAMALINEVIASNSTNSKRTMEIGYQKKSGGYTDYTKNTITSLLNVVANSSSQNFRISYASSAGVIARMIIYEK